MSNWEDSILSIRDNYTQWRFDFTKYLKTTTKYHKYKFFWEMIPMIYFTQNKNGIAWTDKDHNIFLHIPHDKVKLENEKWEFIYYHECLHQLFDTFGVENELIKDEGNAFNHDLLNIASDCVINNYIKMNCDLEYPTDFLITPEYIKETYGIEYVPKDDNQYDLYMKLKKVQDEILDDPLVQQNRENMPDVDIDVEGGGGNVKTVKLPTTDEWKQGSKEARRAANDILSKYNDMAKRQPNGKLSKDEAINMMKKAADEIKKLVGNAVKPNQAKEWFGFHVMNSSEFIMENNSKETDEKYKTFEQGWDYAIDDVLNQIEKSIEEFSQTGGNGGGGGGTQVQSVPENDPTEESPFLPKPNMKGGGSSGSSDNNDDSQNSDSSDSNSDEQIDNMNGQEAAETAQKAADEAKQAAEKAQQKADAEQNISESSSDLQKAAKAAQKAAKDAQNAADKAKEAADDGDDDTAKSEAKKAVSASKEAKKQSQSGESGNGKEGDPEEAKSLGDDVEIDIDWNKSERDGSMSDNQKKGWGDQVEEIRTFAAKNNFGDMTAADVEQAIKRYASGLDPMLSDFVSKCKDSKDLKSSGIIVQTQMQQRNSSWAEKFSDIIKNTVRQRVAKKSSEWNKTYNRPNRRQGIAKNNDVLLKGKMRKKDKLTISLAYYVDVSGSMSQDSINNIFKYIYSMADAIETKYKGNAVVEECIFKTFAFNKEYKEIKRPNIPTRGGGTDSLLEIIQKMKSLSQSYMINVVLTDGDMNYDIPAIKRELEDFAGNIVFITNDHNIASVLTPLTKMEGGNCGNKFELITVNSNFAISDSDFRQV